jgi:hypothetical protein
VRRRPVALQLGVQVPARSFLLLPS